MRWKRTFSLEGEFKLITHLASLLLKEEPLQRQQRPDHVFADSLSLPPCLSSDLTMSVEACMMATKNLLYKLQSNELFIKQKGEDAPFARPMWNASLIDVTDKKIFRFFLTS